MSIISIWVVVDKGRISCFWGFSLSLSLLWVVKGDVPSEVQLQLSPMQPCFDLGSHLASFISTGN